MGYRGLKQWEMIAKELNLGYGYDPVGENELVGQVGDFNLRVATGPKIVGTEFRVESRNIPRELFLRREGLFEQGRDIQTHDEHFDKVVRVRGDERMVFAVLTRKNRVRLFDFVGKRFGVIERGVVQLQLRESINKAAKLRKYIQYVLDVARHVSLPLDDVPQRLAINATGKDQVKIRLRNLELLQYHHGTEAVARQAGLKALKDRRSVIRFQAAVFLREFDMIAKIAAIEAEPVDTRLRAMRFLTENAPSDKVLPLLEKLLDSLNPAVRKEAIADLGWLRHRPAVEKLCRLAASADPETAVVLASALAKIGDPAAEPALLNLLERREEGLKIAAVNALGHIGTATAVEPLMALTGSGLSDLGRAAEEAIARIQSRLGDVEAGRLTLTKLSEREGALSLAREGGELSIPTGGKSLTPGDEGKKEGNS